MRALFCFVIALTLPVFAVAEPAPPAPAKVCSDSEYKPIRGYCSDDYLRIDVLWEATHEPWKAAFNRYFSLITEGIEPDAQIRHSEDASRSRRWRGEFMIVIDRGEARSWRAKQPLKVQLHHLVHDRLYPKIAEAFAKSNLAPDSPQWAATVRAMVPATEQLVREIEIERFNTSGGACPAVAQQIAKSLRLTLPPQALNADGSPVLRIAVHGESYDVVLSQYPRLVHVRDSEGDNPYFAWAEETVSALEPCWKPAT